MVVNNNNYNYGNEIVHKKQNECQVLLSRSTHQMVKNNDIHFDYVSNFGILFRSEYRLVQNDIRQMMPIYNNKDSNNNTCYNFYLCGNRPGNVETYWYYFDISNNGEIPDDELNYQTSKVDSNETTSSMTWKIQARRLDKDDNDDNTKETIDVWKTKVVVQVSMPVITPNNYSKQDQHNQRK